MKKEDSQKEIIEKIEKGILSVFESENWKKHLKVMSKFHNYSINNQVLISMQNPNATLIKGFKSWQNDFKRNVKKGEKGIKILAPRVYKNIIEVDKIDTKTKKPMVDTKGNTIKEDVEMKKIYFNIISVFDISQTEGKEIENLHLTEELKFDIINFNSFFDTLKDISPVPIFFEEIKNGAKGYYSLSENKIAINENMSQAQTVKTAIHEIAHSKLHNTKEIRDTKDINVKEVEAESIAYIVCDYFNIDTSDYSFPYLASWSFSEEFKELKALKSSLEVIQKTLNELIENIEKTLNIKLDIIQSKEVKKSLEDKILEKKNVILKNSENMKREISNEKNKQVCRRF